MPTVVAVRLRFSGKALWFDPAGTTPEPGDRVIVETERGNEIGDVVQAPFEVPAAELPAPLKPVVRVASDEDLTHAAELEAKEAEAMPVFRELVSERKLDMKPVAVEYLFDGDKIVFYFSAEERVDFRDLVRDLASRFHARIDLRQIGVRDEARLVGGLGHCGEQLCCVRFGGEFQPVSIRMAKEQDLPLNPLKISGLCGRLMCCLRYEFDAYKDFKSRAPKRGSFVETPVGEAKVSDLDTPRERITLRYPDGGTVNVPLSGMECCKGGSCPCSVKKEAFVEAAPAAMLQGTDLAPVSEEEPVLVVESADRGRSSQDNSEPRRRRRRSRSGGGESQAEQQPAQQPSEGSGRRRRKPKAAAQSAGQPEQQPKADGATASPEGAGEKSGRSRRRRRRRRGGGGSGGDASAAE